MAKDLVAVEKGGLTPAHYGELADVPPKLEWLANITNLKTAIAYRIDVWEISAFAGLGGARSCTLWPVPMHRLAQGPGGRGLSGRQHHVRFAVASVVGPSSGRPFLR